MSDALKDSLSTMISSASSATKSGKLDDACNWAEQAVQATRESQDVGTRNQVISTVTAVLIKATVETRRSVMRGNGLFGGLNGNVQVIARCASLLADMARGADRGLALAQALVIGGYAKQLTAAIEPHTTTVYKHTDGPTLDGFLTALAEVLKASSKLTTEPLSDGLTQDERNKIAATALSNARHALSSFFSKKLSDWDRARVLNKHAFALVAESSANLKSGFDDAERFLAAFDYKQSEAKLKALEVALGGSGE
jgi:hypothetical protein